MELSSNYNKMHLLKILLCWDTKDIFIIIIIIIIIIRIINI